MNQSNLRFFVLFLLLLNLLGCRSSSDQQSEVLFGEAYKITGQQTKLMEEWAREVSQIFTEQNRAQFPSNRDWLNSRAQKVLPLIDESSRLGNEAAAKLEEASRLISSDQDKRGMALIASSLRKDVEIGEFVKAQAQLASDRTINDEKTFNEKFAYFNNLIQQKQKEKDGQFDLGRRLLLKQ